MEFKALLVLLLVIFLIASIIVLSDYLFHKFIIREKSFFEILIDLNRKK